MSQPIFFIDYLTSAWSPATRSMCWTFSHKTATWLIWTTYTSTIRKGSSRSRSFHRKFNPEPIKPVSCFRVKCHLKVARDSLTSNKGLSIVCLIILACRGTRIMPHSPRAVLILGQSTLKCNRETNLPNSTRNSQAKLPTTRSKMAIGPVKSKLLAWKTLATKQRSLRWRGAMITLGDWVTSIALVTTTRDRLWKKTERSFPKLIVKIPIKDSIMTKSKILTAKKPLMKKWSWKLQEPRKFLKNHAGKDLGYWVTTQR